MKNNQHRFLPTKKENNLYVYENNAVWEGQWVLCDEETFEKTYEDGWSIKGKIDEKYNAIIKFEATHPKLGKVWGDFNNVVYSEKKEAYENLFNKHAVHHIICDC